MRRMPLFEPETKKETRMVWMRHEDENFTSRRSAPQGGYICLKRKSKNMPLPPPKAYEAAERGWLWQFRPEEILVGDEWMRMPVDIISSREILISNAPMRISILSVG